MLRISSKEGINSAKFPFFLLQEGRCGIIRHSEMFKSLLKYRYEPSDYIGLSALVPEEPETWLRNVRPAFVEGDSGKLLELFNEWNSPTLVLLEPLVDQEVPKMERH